MYRKKPHIVVEEDDIGMLQLLNCRGGETLHCVVATKNDNPSRSGDRSPCITLISTDGQIKKTTESKIASFVPDKVQTAVTDVLWEAAENYRSYVDLSLDIRALQRSLDEIRGYLDPTYIQTMCETAQTQKRVKKA